MKPIGHRQRELLADIARRGGPGFFPVVWAELTALGRRRADALLIRRLITVVWDHSGRSGLVYVTEAGERVLSEWDEGVGG